MPWAMVVSMPGLWCSLSLTIAVSAPGLWCSQSPDHGGLHARAVVVSVPGHGGLCPWPWCSQSLSMLFPSPCQLAGPCPPGALGPLGAVCQDKVLTLTQSSARARGSHPTLPLCCSPSLWLSPALVRQQFQPAQPCHVHRGGSCLLWLPGTHPVVILVVVTWALLRASRTFCHCRQ